MFLSIYTFHNQTHCFRASQTEGGHSSLGPSFFHGVEQGGKHSCPAGSDWMAYGHCATMDIDLLFVDSKSFKDGNSGCRKGLVDFEKVNILNRKACLLKSLWN